MKSVALLAGVTSAAVLSPASWLPSQSPISPVSLLAPETSTGSSSYKCDLISGLDPSKDGLPEAKKVFSGEKALKRQVKRHQAIVRVPSVSFDDLGEPTEDRRWEPFYTLHDVLKKTYPAVHKRSKLEKVNTFGLLYTIQGSDPSLKPTLLTAHQDVVPVADESTWKYPPFDAYYDGEYLWGRGASDDKNSLTGLMSALEELLSNDDWVPRRTIILASGFDEECTGFRGAGYLGRFLTERYGDDSMAILLDEGGSGMPKIGDNLYALPAVTEKGHADIWLTLHVNGGHSSVPFPHTGIGIMSEIVSALEAHPYSPKLEKSNPMYGYLTCLARHDPDAQPGLGDLLEQDRLDEIAEQLGGSGPARFLITTSQAVDFISGGVKINAMPEVTKLGVNYRVMQHDPVGLVEHNIVKYIDGVVKKYNLSVSAFEGDDRYAAYVAENHPEELKKQQSSSAAVDYNGRLVLEASDVTDPAPISPISGAVWDVFAGTVQHTFRDDGKIISTGQLMTGNTDTRHYLNLTPNVYRFIPHKEGTSFNAHTVDERVSMSAHMEIVQFYYDFIRNFDAADLGEGEDEAGEL